MSRTPLPKPNTKPALGGNPNAGWFKCQGSTLSMLLDLRPCTPLSQSPGGEGFSLPDEISSDRLAGEWSPFIMASASPPPADNSIIADKRQAFLHVSGGLSGQIACPLGIFPYMPNWSDRDQLQPLVEPQVSHFRQVPLRTIVNCPHSRHMSPSYPLSRAFRIWCWSRCSPSWVGSPVATYASTVSVRLLFVAAADDSIDLP